MVDVGRVAASWAAVAAFETATGLPVGAELSRALRGRGVTEEEIEAAFALYDLECSTVVAGLRGRVADLDAELEQAHAVLRGSEVAAFGEAAVVFAHGCVPVAATVVDAVEVMCPSDWLLFECLARRGGDGVAA